MVELAIPVRAKPADYDGSHHLTKEWPGRNHPDIGRWLIEQYRRDGVVVDPMIGVGAMWLGAFDGWGSFRGARVMGCERTAKGAHIAGFNLIGANVVHADAEWWRPPKMVQVDLVAFSPSFPQAHSAGNTEHQKRMIKEKSDYAIQDLGPMPDLAQVYRTIASYHPAGPVAVIVRNHIRDGVEVDWIGEQRRLLCAAGYGEIESYWRRVLPTRWQQAKLSRDPSTPWIKREVVLVARAGEDIYY